MLDKTPREFWYATMPSQWHSPADGIGHLLMFPVAELKKQRERLLKIIEDTGSVEQIYGEDQSSWARWMIDWVSPAILDELSDVSRALTIADIFWNDTFQSITTAIFSSQETMKRSWKELAYNIIGSHISEDFDVSDSKDVILLLQLFVVDLDWEYGDSFVLAVDSAIQEINKFTSWEIETLPTKYKEFLLKFIEWDIKKSEQKWTLQVWQETLHRHIDSVNNSPISGKEESYTLKDVVNNLRAYFPEDFITAYKKFLQPTSTKDMYMDYPQTETFEAFQKLRERVGKDLEIYVIRPSMNPVDFDMV